MPIMLLHFRSNPTTLGFAIYFLVPVLGSDTLRPQSLYLSVGHRAALRKEDAPVDLRQHVVETCCFLAVPMECSTLLPPAAEHKMLSTASAAAQIPF